jgi:hypothetical protein
MFFASSGAIFINITNVAMLVSPFNLDNLNAAMNREDPPRLSSR